jgi:hypothetical protein
MGVMTDATAIAATYFDARPARDFDRLRSLLADDVDFAGPLAHIFVAPIQPACRRPAIVR